MSSRLWATTIVLVVFLAAIIVLSFLALLGNIPALSVVVLIFTAIAVAAFTYLVINPALLERAKKSAQNMCEAEEIIDPDLHNQLCSRLAGATGDLEATELHKKLTELNGKATKTRQNK